MTEKIVLYLSDFQSGGTEWFALRLADGLAQEGLLPSFLVAQNKGELLPAVRAQFNVETLAGTAYTPLGLLKALPGTIRYLRAHRPKALISGLPLLNIGAALAVRMARTPTKLILVEHMRLSAPRNLKEKIKNRLISWTYAWADHLVAPSRAAAEGLALAAPQLKERIKIIYNPIIPVHFDKLAQAEADHPWLKEKAAPPLILAIGRLLPVKDHATLLRAFAKLREVLPCRLLLLGEGTERPALEKMIEDLALSAHVAMPGTTPNVFPYLKAAALFVLSSTSEAFGNVLAEALACGTKVVSTDCGGPREILEDGKFGRLVPPRNPDALAKAMLDSLQAPQPNPDGQARGLSFTAAKAAQAYRALIDG